MLNSTWRCARLGSDSGVGEIAASRHWTGTDQTHLNVGLRSPADLAKTASESLTCGLCCPAVPCTWLAASTACCSATSWCTPRPAARPSPARPRALRPGRASCACGTAPWRPAFPGGAAASGRTSRLCATLTRVGAAVSAAQSGQTCSRNASFLGSEPADEAPAGGQPCPAASRLFGHMWLLRTSSRQTHPPPPPRPLKNRWFVFRLPRRF